MKHKHKLEEAGLTHNPCQGCEAFYTRTGMRRQCVLDFDGSCKWIGIYEEALRETTNSPP